MILRTCILILMLVQVSSSSASWLDSIVDFITNSSPEERDKQARSLCLEEANNYVKEVNRIYTRLNCDAQVFYDFILGDNPLYKMKQYTYIDSIPARNVVFGVSFTGARAKKCQSLEANIPITDEMASLFASKTRKYWDNTEYQQRVKEGWESNKQSFSAALLGIEDFDPPPACIQRYDLYVKEEEEGLRIYRKSTTESARDPASSGSQ